MSSRSRAALAIVLALGVAFSATAEAAIAESIVKSLVDRIGREEERELPRPGTTLERAIRHLPEFLKSHKEIIREALTGLAPVDWLPYIDAVSTALTVAEHAAEAGRLLAPEDVGRTDAQAGRVLSSPQFLNLAGLYFYRNCKDYVWPPPADGVIEAAIAEARLLRSSASEREKLCRTIVVAACEAPALAKLLNRLPR
jgi:hypothetical protein